MLQEGTSPRLLLVTVLLAGLMMVVLALSPSNQEKDPKVFLADAIENKSVFAYQGGEIVPGVNLRFGGFGGHDDGGLQVALRDVQGGVQHFVHVPTHDEWVRVNIEDRPVFWISYKLGPTLGHLLWVQFHEP